MPYVLVRGKVRARRLIIVNPPHMIYRSMVDSDTLTRVVLGHFCSYPRTRVSRLS